MSRFKLVLDSTWLSPFKSVEEDESHNRPPITTGQARLGELGSNYYLSIGENRLLLSATRLLVI